MAIPAASIRIVGDVSSQLLCDRYKNVSVGDNTLCSNDDLKDEFDLSDIFKDLSGKDLKSENEKEKEDLSLITFKKFLKKNLHKKRIKSGSSSLLSEMQDDTNAAEVVKKRKKKKCSTICLANCRYGLVKKVAKQFGMKEVDESDQWNIFWTDLSVSIERAKEMKRFQKINHFPGMSEICRKDLLARNLNRMLKMFPKDYNFFPKTWCIPADLGEVFAYSKAHPSKTYIVKPDLGCQGKGIFLTKGLKELRNVGIHDRLICQVYIAKPFLVDGFKFDMRVYTLITSVDPLRIFVYNDGLARFATSRYKEPTGHNTTNLYMHLTNYAVNKHSRTYVIDEEAGSKRRLSTLNQYLNKINEDVDKVWASIDDIIIKTVIAAHPVLKHSYNACFSNHDLTYACFELLGFDILLDHKLKPYILEVNHSPSFHTDAIIDKEVKENLLADTFAILNLANCLKRKALDEDKQRARNRLLQPLHSYQFKADWQQSSGEGIPVNFSSRVEEWEVNHLGNYRLIFPNGNTEKYSSFFNQSLCSIFQETFASRAREEARRIEKEEFETKMKEELARRIGGKEKEKDKEKSKINQCVTSESPTHVHLKSCLPKLKKHNMLYSFEPLSIEDADESKRVASMMQRDYLVRSYGIMEIVYKMMKKSGNLRISDVLKYGAYDKTTDDNSDGDKKSHNKYSNDSRITSLMNILPKINSLGNDDERSIRNVPIKLLEVPWQKGTTSNGLTRTVGNKTTYDYNNNSCCGFANQNKLHAEKLLKNDTKHNTSAVGVKFPELAVTCSEVAMWTRPNLPSSKEWPSKLGAKSTKTFIARHFSNTVKLHGLETRLDSDIGKTNISHNSTL